MKDEVVAMGGNGETGGAQAAGDHAAMLRVAAELARSYLAGLPDRPVAPRTSRQALRAALGVPLPEQGEDAAQLIEAVARAADPGLMASSGPRFFGVVAGGTHPAAVASDWLVSAWDQNLGRHLLGPAASVMEDTARGWLVDLLGLASPGRTATSCAFTPGGTAAHLSLGAARHANNSLGAARHALLAAEGWDVERRGLYGARS